MLGCISSDLAVQVSQVFAPGALFLPHLSHYLLKLLVKRGNGVINVLLFIFLQFAILLPGHGLTVLGLGCECQPCRSPDHGEVLFIRLPSKRVQLLLLLVTHLLGDVPAFLLILPFLWSRLLSILCDKELADVAYFLGALGPTGTGKASTISQFLVTQAAE